MKNNYAAKILVYFLFPIFFISGCAGVNTEFSCNASAGDRCIPVEQVNKQAINGEYSENNKPKKNITRVWFASYTDQDGTYHRGTYLNINE